MSGIVETFARKCEELGGYQGFSGGDPIDVLQPRDPPKPMDDKELKAIETIIGAPLPDDYRQFLSKIGGGHFRTLVHVRPIAKRGNYHRELFSLFYCSRLEPKYRLWDELNRYKGRIPNALIPVGANGFGDQFCLGLTEEDKVFFWNHEDERSDEEYWDIHGKGLVVPREWRFGNLTIVASSFTDFLDRMEAG